MGMDIDGTDGNAWGGAWSPALGDENDDMGNYQTADTI